MAESLVLLVLLGLAWTVSGIPLTPDWVPESDFYIPGDVNVGVLAGGTYSHCKYPSSSRRQGRYALARKISEINSDQSILPNITVGLVWLDNCWEVDVALLKSLKFLPQANCFNSCCSSPVPGSQDPDQRGCYDVVGFISPWTDDQVRAVSRLASLYKIPHISLAATNDDLSDRTEYSYFMRINPPDSLLIRVIIDTIVHYNWTYVSLIGDYSQYSRNVVGFFKREVKKFGICIAFFDEMGSDFVTEDYEIFVKRMAVYNKAKVVVLLAETIPTGNFLDSVIDLKLQRNFLFLSTDRYVMSRDGESFVNSLGVGYSIKGDFKKPNNFSEVYKSYSPWAYLTDPFAEKPKNIDKLGCTLEYAEGHNESCFTRYKTWADIPGHFMYGHYETFLDGLDIFTIGLHTLISQECPEAFTDKSLLKSCIDGEKYLKVLYNVTFDGLSGLIKFDSNGDGIIDYVMEQCQYVSENSSDVTDVVVAEWGYNTQKLDLFSDKVKWEDFDGNKRRVQIDVPESVCAKPCHEGEFYIQGELKCCWECRKCRNNEIVRNDSLGCEICPVLTWPDQVIFRECEPIEPSYMLWNDPIAIAIEAISGLGLLSCFMMSYMMIKFRDHKVIKGSSVEQMIMILSAIYLCYVTTILLIVKPGFYLCYIEYCTYHLSCSFIFVPLFLKTTRLYRIFKAAERCQQDVRFVSARALMIFCVILIAGQVIALCISMILFPIGVTRQMPIITEAFVELVCINRLENLLIPLCYNLILLLMCLLFGFLTRKLPDNFNESWYIFLSVATTLFIWIAFLPTYFMAFYAYHKGALLALALILNGAVTFVCLFGPKIYAVYFIPENEIKTSNFDSSSRSTGVSKVTSKS